MADLTITVADLEAIKDGENLIIRSDGVKFRAPITNEVDQHFFRVINSAELGVRLELSSDSRAKTLRRLARDLTQKVRGAREIEYADENTVTHHAVIAGSVPPTMHLIAGGPQEHCSKALEAWIEKHPLGPFEQGLVLEITEVVDAPRRAATAHEASEYLLDHLGVAKLEDTSDEEMLVVGKALRRLEAVEAAWENTPHDGDPLAAIVAALSE